MAADGRPERQLREELLVDDERTLNDLVSAIDAAALIAIDTEFVREQTYYPELCLIQIAGEKWAACVDCLAPLDLQPLLGALLARERSWVLHSARQDLEVVWNLAQALPARVIDTQIAAALLGFPPQTSLQDLLTQMLRIDLEKGYTRTEWRRRPLPAAALRYAFDDVRFLIEAWQILRGKLADLGRLAWFEEDCARLVGAAPVADAETVFRRLKGLLALAPHEQCAALALVEWRERRARESNRPRRWILTDEQLLRLSRSLPARIADLLAVTDLPRGVITRSGSELLAAIAGAESPDRRRIVAGLRLDRKPERSRVALLQSAVKRRAADLGLQTEVLATRKDVNALAAGAALEAVLPGWRAQALAGALPSGEGSSGP